MPELGDAPIEPKHRKFLNEFARTLDKILNKKPKKDVGFIVMLFPFDDHKGRCNYISNANREDVIILLKEQLARFQGQPEQSGRA